MPNKVSENIPDKILTNIPDRMPEIYQIKQNIYQIEYEKI